MQNLKQLYTLDCHQNRIRIAEPRTTELWQKVHR